MRQQPALAAIIGPFNKIVRLAAVFGTPVMLQPDSAQFLGQREQKFITIKMLRSEKQYRLVHQRLVRGDLLRLGLQKLCRVGPDVQRDFIAQIPFAIMRAGK